jgi:hypothetical protein
MFLEKLTVAQLVQNFLHFMGIKDSEAPAAGVSPTSTPTNSDTSSLTITVHLHLGLPSSPFPTSSPIKMYTLQQSTNPATFLVHLRIRDLIILSMFAQTEQQATGENCMVRTFVACYPRQIILTYWDQARQDVWGMWHVWETGRVQRASWWGKLTESNISEDLGEDGVLILQRTLEK